MGRGRVRLAVRRATALLSPLRTTPDHHQKGLAMGQLVMLGTLLGLTVLIVVLVLRFDPEARRPRDEERS